mmetsp:Transcript_60691/g.96082  ORF Transcript_60691/g.96082 Transcript_60691/m.96082 type:complete len:143 (+) Transcript_60691:954-1382(+)
MPRCPQRRRCGGRVPRICPATNAREPWICRPCTRARGQQISVMLPPQELGFSIRCHGLEEDLQPRHRMQLTRQTQAAPKWTMQAIPRWTMLTETMIPAQAAQMTLEEGIPRITTTTTIKIIKAIMTTTTTTITTTTTMTIPM